MRIRRPASQLCVLCGLAPAAAWAPIWLGRTDRPLLRARAPLCAPCALQRLQLATQLADALQFQIQGEVPAPAIAGSSGAPMLLGVRGAAFDGELLNRYFAGAVRCLLWHHWSVALTQSVKAWCLTQFGEPKFRRSMERTGTCEVLEVSLSGAFGYKTARYDDDGASLWLFTLPAALAFADADGQDASIVGVGVAAGYPSKRS